MSDRFYGVFRLHQQGGVPVPQATTHSDGQDHIYNSTDRFDIGGACCEFSDPEYQAKHGNTHVWSVTISRVLVEAVVTTEFQESSGNRGGYEARIPAHEGDGFVQLVVDRRHLDDAEVGTMKVRPLKVLGPNPQRNIPLVFVEVIEVIKDQTNEATGETETEESVA